MDELTGIRIFRRVIELGGFSAAARDLKLSNAAVSKHVAGLEARLGVRLVNRTTRRMSVTEAGRAYYERCARILDDLAEADIAVSQMQSAPRGTLRVNAPMSFGLLHLSPAMPGFLARYPEVTIDLALSDRFVDLIEEGFDLAIRIRTGLPDSGLIARKLAPARRVVCAAPDYLARRGTPQRPEELAGHDCLLYSLWGAPEEWRFAGPDGVERLVRVSGRYRVNNGDSIRAALVAGGGIGLSPTFVVGDDLRAGRLQRLFPGHDAGSHAVYAVYPTNRHLSPKVRAFVDFLADHIGPEPYWDRELWD